MVHVRQPDAHPSWMWPNASNYADQGTGNADDHYGSVVLRDKCQQDGPKWFASFHKNANASRVVFT